MKFCGKCGKPLDNTKKFCTQCGAPNPFHTAVVTPTVSYQSSVSDIEKLRLEKERIERELLEKEKAEQLRQLQLQQEQQRVLDEKLKREQQERQHLEQLKREKEEQEKQERDRITAAIQKKRDEEIAQKLFEQEKHTTLQQIKEEREKLKQELEKIQQLKTQATQSVQEEAKPTKKSSAKKILGWLVLVVFLVGAGIAGYYMYTLYKGQNQFQLAQEYITAHKWSAAAGALSKSLAESNDGKILMSAQDIESAKIWSAATQQWSVLVPKMREQIMVGTTAANYKTIIANFANIDWEQLANAPLQKADVAGAAISTSLLVDSFKLLALQTFLNATDKLQKTETGLTYTHNGTVIDIDKEQTGIINQSNPAISSLLLQTTELKQQVLTSLPESIAPAAPQKKRIVSPPVVHEEVQEEPPTPAPSRGD